MATRNSGPSRRLCRRVAHTARGQPGAQPRTARPRALRYSRRRPAGCGRPRESPVNPRAQGSANHESRRCHRPHPEDRGRRVPERLPHDTAHRGRRARGHPARALPPGARGGGHRRRVCARQQWQKARGVLHAVRAGRGERLPRRRHRLLRLDADAGPAARAPARPGAGLPHVQLGAHVRLRHQVGGDDRAGEPGPRRHAPGHQPDADGTAGTGDGGDPRRRRGRGRGRRRHRRVPAREGDERRRQRAGRRGGGARAARGAAAGDPRRAGRALRRRRGRI